MAQGSQADASASLVVADNLPLGVFLASSSSLFIGASFVVKKHGLRKAADGGRARAAAGGLGYLRQPLWWVGLATSASLPLLPLARRARWVALTPPACAHPVAVGEALNFSAYAFAPPAVVTPLGALSIGVAALGAQALLHERLGRLRLIGCVVTCLGAVPLVLHAPPEVHVASLGALAGHAQSHGFVLYLLTLLSAVALLIARVEPAHGQASPLPGIAICSLVGSLTVVLCKALGLAARLVALGQGRVGDPAVWALLLCLAACVTLQMAYLNKCLDAFPTAEVTPIYYALFTTASLVISASLFQQGWGGDTGSTLTQACSLSSMFCGVALLTAEPPGGDIPPAGGLGGDEEDVGGRKQTGM